MRLTLVPTTTAIVTLLALYACASGAPSDGGPISPPVATGGSTTVQPGNGGAPEQGGAVGQGGNVTPGQGGATTTTPGNGGAAPGVGGAAKGGTTATGVGGAAKGGTPATGGAATGGVQGCTAPATPVAAWKSFAACQATVTEMNSWYTNWKALYFIDCGTQAYIKSTDPNGSQAVVSEGIGYGMLASANLNKPDDFSKLWAFYKARLNGNGVMGWKYPVACTGGAQDSNAASDADVDAAMALIVAAKTFSNATYLADAKTLIASIKKSETLTNCSGGRSILKASDGNWATCDDLNPSYFAPGYYRVFGAVTSDATFWNKMADDALAILLALQTTMDGTAPAANAQTNAGKVPDWGKSTGAIGGTNHATDKDKTYNSDACRTPWRVAVDYGWFQSAGSKTFLTNMDTKVIKAAGGRPYFATTDAQHSSPFVGGFATVGTSVDQATADLYFGDWYMQRTLAGDNKYYADTLKLLYLITMGGRFDNGQ